MTNDTVPSTLALFSVVVPLHNNEETLLRAVNSIFNQTVEPGEIIVVDDASTDGSSAVLNPLVPEKIRLVSRKEPGAGGYAARNLGATMSQNPWIAFLDADDEWRPQHLELAKETILENPDVDLIFFGFEVIYESGKKRLEHVEKSDTYSLADCLQLYAQGECFHTNSVLIKKSLFENVGGFRDDPEVKRGADAELWVRLIMKSQKTYISKIVTTRYYRHTKGVVGRRNNITGMHPVAHLAHCILQNVNSKQQAKSLMQIANRKTASWILSTRSRRIFLKLRLFRSLFWNELDFGMKKNVLLSFFRRI